MALSLRTVTPLCIITNRKVRNRNAQENEPKHKRGKNPKDIGAILLKPRLLLCIAASTMIPQQSLDSQHTVGRLGSQWGLCSDHCLWQEDFFLLNLVAEPDKRRWSETPSHTITHTITHHHIHTPSHTHTITYTHHHTHHHTHGSPSMG
jgi:hypothetical protein